MDVTVDCLSNFISPNKYKYDWLCIHYTFILWQNIGVSVDASTGAKVGITPIIIYVYNGCFELCSTTSYLLVSRLT